MSLRSESFEQVLGAARARRGVLLMGVCNVTPDSFSDGGRYLDFRDARACVDALFADGADIVDIGAESTRPGAAAVPADEQLRRVLAVVRYAAQRGWVSIDTTSPAVAAECLQAGAIAVNDVSCLRNEELAEVAARAEAAFILMHARGTQAEMRGFSVYPRTGYADVVRDVVSEWLSAAERAIRAGVSRTALVMDPGLGFAKNADQSTELLRHLHEIVGAVGVPVLVGASRKSFLKIADEGALPNERIGGSIASALFAVRAGASLLRVHDVRATRQAVDLDRMLSSSAPLGPTSDPPRPAHA